MLNLPLYGSYNGETCIALLDNSSIEFLEKIEHAGSNYVENLLKDYDVIFIPEWVLEEVTDSEFRSKFVERMAEKLPICKIEETKYSALMDGRELALYDIVNASVANISTMLAYLRRNVAKDDPMDMDAYEDWIKEMYDNWPMPGETLLNGRVKKKNAGEVSLTILAEIFSWYYPESKTLTIYSQDADTKAFQNKAEEKLSKLLKDKIPVAVSFKSNDFLLSRLYREKMISEDEVKNLRKNSRTVTYTRKRSDESVVLEKRRLENDEFLDFIQDD
ncbi:MAG: hypothetical protein IIW54_02650, partial [Lachnospiraceae bacterium]|nr:hypothetical protein [Lachnospiraceae bacterium]